MPKNNRQPALGNLANIRKGEDFALSIDEQPTPAVKHESAETVKHESVQNKTELSLIKRGVEFSKERWHWLQTRRLETGKSAVQQIDEALHIYMSLEDKERERLLANYKRS